MLVGWLYILVAGLMLLKNGKISHLIGEKNHLLICFERAVSFVTGSAHLFEHHQGGLDDYAHLMMRIFGPCFHYFEEVLKIRNYLTIID